MRLRLLLCIALGLAGCEVIVGPNETGVDAADITDGSDAAADATCTTTPGVADPCSSPGQVCPGPRYMCFGPGGNGRAGLESCTCTAGHWVCTDTCASLYDAGPG